MRMMFAKGESDDNSRLARSQTDPLWLQDHFLGTGHDITSRNGTASFVLFRGRQFAVTCRHILQAATDPTFVVGARNPTAALQIDRTILNLSHFSAAGLQTTLAAPNSALHEQEVDIALCELTGSYWDLLRSKKGKKPIDLDAWREPKWAEVRMCVAAGYPDEHKEVQIDESGDMVASPMFQVVAEVASALSRDCRIITLSSRLDQPHNYYFSGISGGTLYAIEDHGWVPAGVVFEGYPSSRQKAAGGANEPPFLDQNDIFIRALTLTPEIFEEWLKGANLIR